MSLRRRFVLALSAYAVAVAAVLGVVAWKVSGTALEAQLKAAQRFKASRSYEVSVYLAQVVDDEELGCPVG